jgi:hypothetical protein
METKSSISGWHRSLAAPETERLIQQGIDESFSGDASLPYEGEKFLVSEKACQRLKQ